MEFGIVVKCERRKRWQRRQLNQCQATLGLIDSSHRRWPQYRTSAGERELFLQLTEASMRRSSQP